MSSAVVHSLVPAPAKLTPKRVALTHGDVSMSRSAVYKVVTEDRARELFLTLDAFPERDFAHDYRVSIEMRSAVRSALHAV